MKELSQKQFITKRTYKITETSLIYGSSDFSEFEEVAISYENIYKTSLTSKRLAKNTLFSGITLILCSIFYYITWSSE